jgi:hypothetical protein
MFGEDSIQPYHKVFMMYDHNSADGNESGYGNFRTRLPWNRLEQTFDVTWEEVDPVTHEHKWTINLQTPGIVHTGGD